MSSDLYGTDPGQARRRRQLLERLATNTKNPKVAEMARDLMAGKLSPQDLMSGASPYAEEFNKGMASFTTWYASASDDERAEAEQAGRDTLDDLAREELGMTPVASPDRRPRPKPATEADEDFSDETWMY